MCGDVHTLTSADTQSLVGEDMYVCLEYMLPSTSDNHILWTHIHRFETALMTTTGNDVLLAGGEYVVNQPLLVRVQTLMNCSHLLPTKIVFSWMWAIAVPFLKKKSIQSRMSEQSASERRTLVDTSESENLAFPLVMERECVFTAVAHFRRGHGVGLADCPLIDFNYSFKAKLRESLTTPQG